VASVLDVYFHERHIGKLTIKDNGNLQFKYDAAYLLDSNAACLSQSLPLQEDALPHRACLSFFGGLLPEAEARDQVAEAIGVSPTNDYVLLERFGGDCAGAVTLLPEGYAPTQREPPEMLNEEQLDDLVRGLPQRPLAADYDGKVRLSLAGAQPKVPVIYDGTNIFLPKDSATPTTHILKPEPARFPGLVENEYFCMWLARLAELPVAEVEKRETKSGQRYLLVTRYDRDRTLDPVRRLHQEDFCQALSRLAHEKYQQEGGPSIREAMDLLTKVSPVPAVDRPRLWDALVFNVLIGNCDAHGKNYSLLYDSKAPHLAPLYDLVSTAVYENLTSRLAMSINGAQMLVDVKSSSWREAANDISMNPSYAEERRRELTTHIVAMSHALLNNDAMKSPETLTIVEGIDARAKAMAA
jgi:serine/threonine-protein kinase HipA